jgi:hypothetical protein
MKKLSTRKTHYKDGLRILSRYRLPLEHTRVCIETELLTWEDGPEPEFRVDFCTGKTRHKENGGSHGWENPVAAFRAISKEVARLYEEKVGQARLLVFAGDEARYRLYKRILKKVVDARGGYIVEGFKDDEGQPGMEYRPW